MRPLNLFFILILAMASCNIAMAGTVTNLTIHSKNGDHHFKVELALTPEDQEQGLMWRRGLAGNGGMLFYFSTPRQISMWMHNTVIPLDMVFITPDGHIGSIAKNAVPYSDAQINSGMEISAVLELSGGTIDRLSLAKGDVVHDAPYFQ